MVERDYVRHRRIRQNRMEAILCDIDACGDVFTNIDTTNWETTYAGLINAQWLFWFYTRMNKKNPEVYSLRYILKRFIQARNKDTPLNQAYRTRDKVWARGAWAKLDDFMADVNYDTQSLVSLYIEAKNKTAAEIPNRYRYWAFRILDLILETLLTGKPTTITSAVDALGALRGLNRSTTESRAEAQLDMMNHLRDNPPPELATGNVKVYLDSEMKGTVDINEWVID